MSIESSDPPLKLLRKPFVAGTIAFKGNTAVYVVPRAGLIYVEGQQVDIGSEAGPRSAGSEAFLSG